MNIIKKYSVMLLSIISALFILNIIKPILNMETFSRFEAYYFIHYSLSTLNSDIFKIFIHMPLSQFFYFITNHFEIKFIYIFIFSIIWIITFFSYKISDLIGSKFKYILLFFIIISVFYFYDYALDIEQIFFSAYILLFLIIFIERDKNYNNSNIKLDILAGASLGFTLLIRSSLIIIPILVLIYDIIDKKKNFSFKKSILFILFAYLPLIPWTLLSKYILGKFLLTEYNRANLNIITGALGITLTAEGDISKVIGSQDINPYLFAIKIILAEPINYIMAIIRRLYYFLSLNIFLIIPSIYVIYKDHFKKEIKILALFVISFVFIHSLFSVEKRYFFPVSIILSILSSSLIKTSPDEKNISYRFIRNWFILLFAPVLIMYYQVIKYPFSNKKPVEKFIQTQNYVHPDIYLIAALENLSYYNRDRAILHFELFLKNSKKTNLLKKNISELMEILKNKLKGYPQTSHPLNNHFIKALMIIKSGNIELARNYINKRWEYISQSYLRSDITSNELYTDIEIRKYIKKTGYIYTSFPLVESEIKKASKICDSFNDIISKIGSKDQLDCNLEERMISRYIENFCTSLKNQPDFNEILEVIDLERAEKLEKAKEKIFTLIKQYPNYYKVYTEAGNIYILSQDFKKAKEYFEKSIELCPYAKDSYYGLQTAYKKLGMKKELTDVKNKAKEYNIDLSYK